MNNLFTDSWWLASLLACLTMSKTKKRIPNAPVKQRDCCGASATGGKRDAHVPLRRHSLHLFDDLSPLLHHRVATVSKSDSIAKGLRVCGVDFQAVQMTAEIHTWIPSMLAMAQHMLTVPQRILTVPQHMLIAQQPMLVVVQHVLQCRNKHRSRNRRASTRWIPNMLAVVQYMLAAAQHMLAVAQPKHRSSDQRASTPASRQ